MLRLQTAAAVGFVALAVLSPALAVAPGLPTLRAEDAILVLFALSKTLWRRAGDGAEHRGSRRRVDIAFATMATVALFSIGVSSLQKSIIVNDFMILPMLARYWLVFRFAWSLSEDRTRDWVLYALMSAIGLSALAGIMQYYDWGGINQWMMPHYLGAQAGGEASAVERQVATGRFRVIGTAADPRHYGYLLVLGIATGASSALIAARKTHRTAGALLIGVCMVSLIYTASRSAVVCAAVVVVSATHILHRRRELRGATIGLIIAGGLLFGALFARFGTDYFRERVMDTGTESFQMSAHARKRDLLTPFVAAVENPTIFLVGIGPSKKDTRQSTHNDVGWYFHRFGLLGVGCYLSLIVMGIREGYRTVCGGSDRAEGVLRMAALLTIMAWATFLMAENVFKNVQLMSLNMFALGLLLSPASMRRRRPSGIVAPERRNREMWRRQANRNRLGAEHDAALFGARQGVGSRPQAGPSAT